MSDRPRLIDYRVEPVERDSDRYVYGVHGEARRDRSPRGGFHVHIEMLMSDEQLRAFQAWARAEWGEDWRTPPTRASFPRAARMLEAEEDDGGRRLALQGPPVRLLPR